MLYNSKSYSFSDVQVTGFPGDAALFRAGLQGITCNDEAMLTAPRGADPIALPTGGAYAYSVSAGLELALESFEQLLEVLGDAYAEQKFNLTCSLGAKRGLKIVKREFMEAQIVGVPEDHKRESPNGLVVPIKLSVRYLLRNGKCLVRRDL